MVRPAWQNLNGLWEYTILAKDAARPQHFTGQILVPYPLESALSHLHPHWMFYSASRGIWQTVWLELVPSMHVERLKFTADVDRSELRDFKLAADPLDVGRLVLRGMQNNVAHSG